MDRSDFPNVRVLPQHEELMRPIVALLGSNPRLAQAIQSRCSEEMKRMTELLHKKNDHPEFVTPSDTAEMAQLIRDVSRKISHGVQELQ